MGYVVNEDKPTDSAHVHRETCEYYTERLPKTPKDGGWLGPFKTEDEAFAKARATGRTDVGGSQCCFAETGLLDRAKGVVGSVRRRVERSAEVMSGADIRRFEEFTDAATTAVIGVHRDQAELREHLTATEQSLDELQQGQAKLVEILASIEHSVRARTESEERSTSSLSPWTIAFGAMSAVALLLSIVAVVMAVS